MDLLSFCGEKEQVDQNPVISQEAAWPEAEILQEGESIQLQECQVIMPCAGQSSTQPGILLALKHAQTTKRMRAGKQEQHKPWVEFNFL